MDPKQEQNIKADPRSPESPVVETSEFDLPSPVEVRQTLDCGTRFGFERPLSALEEMKCILLGWEMLPVKPIPEEERESDVKMFDQCLRTAECVGFSGTVTFAFTGGYLRTMEAWTAKDTFEEPERTSEE